MSTLRETVEELERLEVDNRRWRVRRYAPHPLAPREDEEDPRERTFEQVMEDETGQPAFGPL